jgi:putative ABC transport system permease protein
MSGRHTRIPLAWKNLTHNLRRLGLACAGIGFAVLLIFMQLGFQGALYDSTVQIPLHLNADIVIINRIRNTLTIKETFERERLYTACACPGVKSAHALYLENRYPWKNPQTGHSYAIRALAFDPSESVLQIPDVAAQSDKLFVAGNVLFDRLSKPDYGSPAVGQQTDYAGKRVTIVGEFSLGTDFANDGNIVMSDVTYAKYLSPPGGQSEALSDVDIGLVKIDPNADVREVKRTLIGFMPPDVVVLTKDELVAREQQFWRTATPIGYVFKFGVALGFIVGIIICYQILYADISDHLPEYATLKAMGYPPSYFIGVVLQEALLLSILGFIPGMVCSEILYGGLGKLTGLLLELNVMRAVGVLAITSVMCVISGLFTMRKLLSLDPAELFA